MFGHTMKDIMNSTIDDLLSNDETREQALNVTRSVSEGNVEALEAVRKCHNGTMLDVSILASPIVHDGVVVATYAIYRDITVRKRNQQRISELNGILQQITGILRHDMMNNLMIIDQAAQMCMLDGNLERLEMLLASVKRSVSLIDRMREFEASLANGERTTLYPFKKLVEEVVRDSGLMFEISGDADILLDAGFFTVVQNLVMNAIRHGNAQHMTFSVLNDEGWYTIEIGDDGTGVPEKIKGLVFDQGFSYGNSRGSGSGLHLTKLMVGRMGGTISIHDNRPAGTTFRIRIPAEG
jgi:PAS domain S-box-containing protein